MELGVGIYVARWIAWIANQNGLCLIGHLGRDFCYRWQGKSIFNKEVTERPSPLQTRQSPNNWRKTARG